MTFIKIHKQYVNLDMITRFWVKHEQITLVLSGDNQPILCAKDTVGYDELLEFLDSKT